jgi:hypothetical protein
MDPAPEIEEQRPKYGEEEGGDCLEFDSPSNKTRDNLFDDDETSP